MARKTKRTTATSTVRNIRRNSLKRYSGEEKIWIILEDLRGEETVAELCRRERISESIIGTRFAGQVLAKTQVGSGSNRFPTVIPKVTGSAYYGVSPVLA